MDGENKVYVSITGLRTKSIFHVPLFWWHAFATVRQVRKAEGNLLVKLGTINGIQHTMTVWKNERAMKRFLYQGAHGKAIKVFPSIATGKTLGFETNQIPSFDDVNQIWEERGRDYAA